MQNYAKLLKIVLLQYAKYVGGHSDTRLMGYLLQYSGSSALKTSTKTVKYTKVGS